MPARGGRGGDRASRERLGAAAAQVVARARRGGQGRVGGGGAAPTRTAGAVRRDDRRLPGPLRHARGAADRPEAPARLQSSRLALRDARRRSRPLRARIASGVGVATRRSNCTATRRPRRRRHGSERALPGRARGDPPRSGGGVLRRRGGSALSTGLAAAGALPRSLRGEADPAARARDDPGGCSPRAGDLVSDRRQRPARPRYSPAGRPMSSGSSGSSTKSCRRRSSARVARSGSSGPPRRRRG